MSQALATASSAHQSNGLSDHASYPSPARSNTLLQTFPADADASRSRMSAMAWVRALALTPSSAARACKRAKNLRRSLSDGASGTWPSTATWPKSAALTLRLLPTTSIITSMLHLIKESEAWSALFRAVLRPRLGIDPAGSSVYLSASHEADSRVPRLCDQV